MAENSAISWTRHTWNPWMGCTKVSPACDGCYAEAMMDKRYHKVEWGGPGKGVGTRVRTSAHTWNDPYRWQRQAEKDGDRPFVFCASLADIFDNQVDPQWRADAFDVMRKTPRLVYLLLTKRPQNVNKLAFEAGGLPRNAAIGTTIEDQKRADINVPALLDAKSCTSALFAFVSCEPLLGPIDLNRIHESGVSQYGSRWDSWESALNGRRFDPWSDGDIDAPKLDWVIAGGETDQGGHIARRPHPDWFRSLRDQCAAAAVPFHFKQWGNWAPPAGLFPPDTLFRAPTKIAGRLLDGGEHNEFPAVPAL
ncbi:phage Gp37/Gp68 family protein [Rhizobium sp. PRIMUS64]|uniref:DUF5131 family protein n=1 Tax=Rhizobium sp. PRIMUS64 TaxID=2908925 RepID=UPI001FF2F026|nr:phage Gp37/Gp68 family protein [Rhizobium sp. PRIMUS64]MCJ9697560.1 phage Gp37/Gp68 family protein [Rhizobium sp. PRIMUS64]